MAQVCFSHTGADAPDQLSPQRRVVYQGTAPLPDKSSDITRQITNSVSIPAALTKQLSAIRGKFFLNKTPQGFKNAHIFSPLAKTVDGINRICYIQYLPRINALHISECGSRRGAKYSALYPLLSQCLQRNGFLPHPDGAFALPADSTPTFVRIVNRLIDSQQRGELELLATDETESILFDSTGKRQYFYRVRWQKAAAPAQPPAERAAVIPAAGARKTQAPRPDTETAFCAAEGGPAENLLEECGRPLLRLAESCICSADPVRLRQSLTQLAALRERLQLAEEVCQSQLSLLEKLQQMQ